MINDCSYSIIEENKQKEIFECKIIEANINNINCITPIKNRHKEIVAFNILNNNFKFDKMTFDNKIKINLF